jgi:hypothetical protein
VNPSETNENPHGEQPDKSLQIGRAVVTRALLNAERVVPQSAPRRPALAPL